MTSRCHRVPAGREFGDRARAVRSRAVLAWLAAQAVRSLRILRQCSRAAHGRDQSEHPPSSRLTRVVFYRARPADADGVAWDVTIRGRIFEREMDSGAARSSATLGRARSAARARQQLLSAAIRAFSSTTNRETYRRLNRQGLQTCGVARQLLRGSVRLREENAATRASCVSSGHADGVRGSLKASASARRDGVSVVCDIDDTVKISECVIARSCAIRSSKSFASCRCQVTAARRRRWLRGALCFRQPVATL